MQLRMRFATAVGAVVTAAVVWSQAGVGWGAGPATSLTLDATEAPRRILHARLLIPAAPGALTLEYPKWIRGEHGPNGPIADLAGLKLSANGRAISWRRDDVDMYAFHCDVPAGASSVSVELDYLMPVRGGVYTAGVSSTADLAILNWYEVVLYPKGTPSDDVTVVARLRLPAAWKFATALPVAHQSEAGIEFEPASLTTLADSPVLCGAHFRAVPLGVVGGAAHELDIAADSEAALRIPPATVEKCKRLVAEFQALFGAHHYRGYRWLLALTDRIRRSGIEHLESSDDRFPERAFLDDGLLKLLPGLLAHEYTHSWNGKYGRPAGLSGADFEQPMKGDLLWVYEGLTTYIGSVMPVRSGFITPQDYREELAGVADAMNREAGRTWRSLEDTAVAAQILYSSPEEWRAWRRGTDFYTESLLIWLEADVVIRRQTGGRRSLDDFCRSFYGGQNTPPMLKPYTLDDVLASLNEVAPYDWRGFFEKRVTDLTPGAPLGGIEGSGWKLVATSEPNSWSRVEETAWQFANLTGSVGLRLKPDGTVVDVIPGSPAAAAGLGPGMTVAAVNGRAYDTARLRQAIRDGVAPGSPLDLLVRNDDEFATARVDYHGGERYPHLERNSSEPDLLTEILEPRSTR